MSTHDQNLLGVAPDARVGNADAAFSAVALYDADMADPTVAGNARPEGFTNTEVEWVVLLPPGATGADLCLWRWVEFIQDRTMIRRPRGYPAGQWVLETRVAITAAAFILQYGNGLGLACTVKNIAGTPTDDGFIGVRGLTKRS
jgi:hypothetical protein